MDIGANKTESSKKQNKIIYPKMFKMFGDKIGGKEEDEESSKSEEAE